jgi:hypothetical protein
MFEDIDMLDSYLEENPDVLDILLFDRSSGRNILWATDDLAEKGPEYTENAEILPHLITGDFKIIPRFRKVRSTQDSRAKSHGEIFTPAWLCNQMNNGVDENFLAKDSAGFNREIKNEDTRKNTWKTSKHKVVFKEGIDWVRYIMDVRLEAACGEGAFTTSRYDAQTGKFIPTPDRIGLLDRKLRVVNENVDDYGVWVGFVKIAYQATYATEFLGDSTFLARKNVLSTFFENHFLKFKKQPLKEDVLEIAEIISWNVWQMDFLKQVVPNSCLNAKKASKEFLKSPFIAHQDFCQGCLKGYGEGNNIHNGIPCLIRLWHKNKIIKFADAGSD